jgi:hypothetical protein
MPIYWPGIKKYYISIFILSVILGLVWLFNVLNPRYGEDVVVKIYGQSKSDLLKIKVYRLNLKNELTQLQLENIQQSNVIFWKVSNAFVSRIVLRMPNNNICIDSIQIAIGASNFILKPLYKIISVEGKREYIVPDIVRNHHFKLPILGEIINLPANFIPRAGFFWMIGLAFFFLFSSCGKKFYINNSNLDFRFTALPHYSKIIIFISCSCFLTFLIGYSSFVITRTYNAHYPYFLDPVGNNSRFVAIYENLKHESRLGEIIQQLRTNETNPFRGFLVILLAPNLLKSAFGHMFNTIIFIFCFFFLSLYSFYKSNVNIVYSFSLILLFAMAPILISPHDGIGQFWQDLSAGFPLACAGICYYNWHLNRKLFLLVLFTIFLSLTILSRYNSVFYALLLFGPLIFYSISLHWKRTRDFFITVFIPSIAVISILILLCGYWLVKHYSYNVHYYSGNQSFGNTGFGPLTSLIGLLSRILVDFKIEYLFLIFIILLFSFRKNRISIADKPLLFWFLLSFPIFWIFILGLDSMRLGKVYLIGFPLMYFAIAQIASSGGTAYIDKTKLAIILIGFSCVIGVFNFKDFLFESKHPPYRVMCDKKAIQLRLAEAVAKLNVKDRKLYFNAFIDREQDNLNLQLETYYKTGKLLDLSRNHFSSDSSFFLQRNNKTDTNIIGNQLFGTINDSLNLIVIPKDTLLIEHLFNNNYSRFLAKKITCFIQNNPSWKELAQLKTYHYSNISIYYKP